MKRSRINQAIIEMENLLEQYKFALPPFSHWTPEDWEKKGHEYDEIRDNQLGWDVTDYGEGDFEKTGFTLFTIRNGNTRMQEKYCKPYAEKLIMLCEGQYSPMHFHWSKMEDIINRGGGNLLIRVYNATEDDQLDSTDVRICSDGRTYFVPAGTQIRLTPGESISIYQRMYHDFEVEHGTGHVLIGEVSMCNDDNSDNRFHKPLGRFPKIDEDTQPYRLLCNEYPETER